MTVDIESQRRYRPVEETPANPVHWLWLTVLPMLNVLQQLFFDMARNSDQPITFWRDGGSMLMLIVAMGSAHQLYRMARKAMPTVEQYQELGGRSSTTER